MALGEFTKQLAQQALLNATAKEPAPPAQAPAVTKGENIGATILAQIGAMQKALKDDEEMVILFQNGAAKIRVTEIYMPSWGVAVLSGSDQDRVFARVISPVEALQLVIRLAKTPGGAKPGRISLIAPKG